MIDENSVFVSNLAWITSEMNLGRHFESYGEI
jgi:RNA recognition motif-containing protein